MKKLILLILFSVFILQSCISQSFSPNAQSSSGKMNLLSPYFFFTENGSPKSSLSKNDTTGQFVTDEFRKGGFSIRIMVNLKDFSQEETILELSDIVSLKLRQTDPTDRWKQNYPAFPMKDGRVPVMEARITLNAPEVKTFTKDLVIGFPIAELKQPWGPHEVVLYYNGVLWTIYVDGQIMDNDFVIGYPNFTHEVSWLINPDLVSKATIFSPAFSVTRDSSRKNESNPDVQFWMPRWHNAWVGDVATLYFNGRYHVFYLFDRRHHGSKMGVGGHYFEHFSTTDFTTWTEHEAAVPIEEQWETIGTGTPFVFNNQLNIAYGMHTSRIYPEEKTMRPIQKKYYENQGKTGAFPFDLSKGYPSGASYSVSKNGLDSFKKSRVMFHYAENPSVYVDPQGKLKMIANFGAQGIWTSETPDSNWRSISPDFPTGGDCTFFFRWGKFDYIIGGFVNLWIKPADAKESGWVDMVKKGLDFYDGINVPSIAKINNNRYLMAGWFPIHGGWGGPFVVHELIQLPDGRIRSKWMKELIPSTSDTLTIAKKISGSVSFPVNEKEFILVFDVYPLNKESGRLAVSFLSQKEEYKNGCQFQVDTKALIAQYGSAVKDSFAIPELSLRNGGSPNSVGNYSIENLTGTGKPFTVRILVKNNTKLGGSILDAEIAGQNTMISYRQNLFVGNIVFNIQKLEIRNLKLLKVTE